MSRPNFVIVENPVDEFDWEEFKRDYLDDTMSVDDICKKYDISKKRYYSHRKRLIEETGVSFKPNAINNRSLRFNDMKHIYHIGLTGKYRVSRFKKKRSYFFGNYDSLEIAKEVRDLLIEHDWSQEYYKKVIVPKYNPTLDKSTPKGFEEDFLDGMPMNELKEKYGLTNYQYTLISHPIKLKHGLVKKPTKIKVKE